MYLHNSLSLIQNVKVQFCDLVQNVKVSARNKTLRGLFHRFLKQVVNLSCWMVDHVKTEPKWQPFWNPNTIWKPNAIWNPWKSFEKKEWKKFKCKNLPKCHLKSERFQNSSPYCLQNNRVRIPNGSTKNRFRMGSFVTITYHFREKQKHFIKISVIRSSNVK